MLNQRNKRIIVCCDGTWNWPDQKGNPTNVVKMVRAILPIDHAGIHQVVFYDTGVGTGNLTDRIGGGMFGIGLSNNVKRAYGHIVDNYQPDDELYFFGFSRGAFTVRSLGGLIGLVGLLQKETMDRFEKAWDYYRIPPPKRPSKETFEAQFGSSPPRPAKIHCIGVWDTVGDLGIPFGPLRFIGRRLYQFHNTNLGDNVAYAFQALAIDEHRKVFKPAIWKRDPGATTGLARHGIRQQVLEQVWFTGAHSNVGGGYADTGLSDLALVWMARKAASSGLAVDEAYVNRVQDGTQYLLVNSRTLKWRLQQPVTRELCVTDPSERIHATAVMRFEDKFPAPFAPTPYECPNLGVLKKVKGPTLQSLVVS